MRRLDSGGSIVPLAVVFLVIVIGGLLIGVLTVIIDAVSNTDNNINTLFTLFWGFISLIVLVVIGFWALVKAQRSG